MSEAERITQSELQQLFGDRIPVEAVNLFWNCPPEWTLDKLRAEIRKLAPAYTRADLDAATLAAYEAAAMELERWAEPGVELDHCLTDEARAIRDLIPADALAARDRALQEAREAERQAIFERITEYIDAAPCDGINAEGEFSEAVRAGQRKFIDGMRQARAAATSRAAAIRAAADNARQ
ncbi:hypothetical protein [Citreimonas sp.]|uniref:hypothetical protein n=1 Tax=Citreimonas sp. TaxID=3036715 RepID=UPI00405992EB